jgi:hypothetical protein
MAWFPETTEAERAPEIAPPSGRWMPFPEWSEEEVARLLALRAEGLTCVQVAERMGKTKGMIVGKLYRMANKNTAGDPPQEVEIVEPQADESDLEELALALVEAVPEIEIAEPPTPPRARDFLDVSAPRLTPKIDHSNPANWPECWKPSKIYSNVGPRGNEGPLEAGGWRITPEGRLLIHCLCGTEFTASTETGMGGGSAGICIGCRRPIMATCYYELWSAGKTGAPIQWQRG